MPVLSLGSMRFQQSWKDLHPDEITPQSQKKLEKTLQEAVIKGFNHIETARHYGTSELQLGWAMKNLPDPNRIIQTKIPPREDPKQFEAELELSFRKLNCQKLDLLAIHGLNLPEHLEQTVRQGGCLDVVKRWQKNGLISSVGFSTHGSTDLIVDAIKTNQFDYVNLHWYFIRPDNESALTAAADLDLGIFIISPTDKGGHLHTPSSRLLELCDPLHPIVFNDLFCLRDQRVHTISVGAAKPEDLVLHLKAISLLPRADELLSPIQQRLSNAAISTLGESWVNTWHVGLPSWQKTPGNMNVPVLLWLHNLIEAWDMESFAKSRYGLLGNGSHWFPGENADCLDHTISEKDLQSALIQSPWSKKIPGVLRHLRSRLANSSESRLSHT